MKHEVKNIQATTYNDVRFRFTTLTKQVNNQTNCCICFGNFEKNMDQSHIHLAICSKVLLYKGEAANIGVTICD